VARVSIRHNESAHAARRRDLVEFLGWYLRKQRVTMKKMGFVSEADRLFTEAIVSEADRLFTEAIVDNFIAQQESRKQR